MYERSRVKVEVEHVLKGVSIVFKARKIYTHVKFTRPWKSTPRINNTLIGIVP